MIVSGVSFTIENINSPQSRRSESMESSVPPSSSQRSAPSLANKGRRSLVEREAESFAKQKSKYPRRAKALRPTWVEFRSKSFTEYVQHALFDDGEDNVGKHDKPRKIEWNHGIVKITLPEGWWDESGIGKDRTARGPAVSHVMMMMSCSETGWSVVR